jgi:hypothetical protein
MLHNNRPARLSLHGYQPMVVGEDCLSVADVREALFDVVANPRDWKEHVSQQEWETLEKELAEIQRQAEIERSSTPNVFYCGEPPEMEKKRQALVQRGSLRAFARAKYAAGQGIWYGDLVPWLSDSG